MIIQWNAATEAALTAAPKGAAPAPVVKPEPTPDPLVVQTEVLGAVMASVWAFRARQERVSRPAPKPGETWEIDEILAGVRD